MPLALLEDLRYQLTRADDIYPLLSYGASSPASVAAQRTCERMRKAIRIGREYYDTRRTKDTTESSLPFVRSAFTFQLSK